MSLRTKASLLVSFSVILFFTIGGVLVLRYHERSLKNLIYNELKIIAQDQSQFISTFLKDTFEDAQAIASFLPSEAIKGKKTSVIESYLKRLYKTYPKFENGIFLLDQKGYLWVDYPPYPELRGTNFSHRNYFQTTMKAQKGVIGPPYQSAHTGLPVVTFTSPLMDSRSEVIGVLGCSIQLLQPKAFGEIRGRKIGLTGYIYVTEASGKIIIHPEHEQIFQRVSPIPVLALDGPSLDRGQARVEETIGLHGKPILRSAVHIPETNWVLVVQQDKSEAFEPLCKARKRGIIYTIVIIVISILISNLAILKITGPLRKLHQLVLELKEKGVSEKLVQKTKSTFLPSRQVRLATF